MARTVVAIAIFFEISQQTSKALVLLRLAVGYPLGPPAAGGIVHLPAACRNAICAIPTIRRANG
jgi:hypothetical protein